MPLVIQKEQEINTSTRFIRLTDFAFKHGYTIVTKDVDFVNLCYEKNVPVGVLKGNRLFLISESKQLFGEKLPNRLFTTD